MKSFAEGRDQRLRNVRMIIIILIIISIILIIILVLIMTRSSQGVR